MRVRARRRYLKSRNRLTDRERDFGDVGATSLMLSTAAGPGELVGRAVTLARRPGA